MNGEHNKKGSPEVNRVRSLTRSMIWGPVMLPELQEVPELTWCYNRNNKPENSKLTIYANIYTTFVKNLMRRVGLDIVTIWCTPNSPNPNPLLLQEDAFLP